LGWDRELEIDTNGFSHSDSQVTATAGGDGLYGVIALLDAAASVTGGVPDWANAPVAPPGMTIMVK